MWKNGERRGKFRKEEGVELGNRKATENGVRVVVPKTRDTGV
jgi:hypothetical protein